MAPGEMKESRAGLRRQRTADADLHTVGQHIEPLIATV